MIRHGNRPAIRAAWGNGSSTNVRELHCLLRDGYLLARAHRLMRLSLALRDRLGRLHAGRLG